ncbi:MAG: ATP phosphoribosyltransferase regulatory subunit [Pseudomonadota bacterium]|jgi:ATP phosphoribosyltransferase regulatory subunit
MDSDDRWLLPDGIEEILPDRALRVERLRRRLLDLFHTWGYDLVIPPLAEFTTALFSGAGSDLDLMTFKITDQLSGRMMGVRADITPQAARMDAHSLRREGPSRLCYAGQVLYTRPRNPLESRSPIQLGVELFGEAGLAADLEVIALLVETLHCAGVADLHLDLGHVGIYRGLELALGLDAQRGRELFELLQRKDAGLAAWIDAEIADPSTARLLRALPGLCGGPEVLERAATELASAPDAVLEALEQLRQVAGELGRRHPGLGLFLDLGELRGYRYHTGIVFAAYCSATTAALGHGGRYDRVGADFGRARPATGFGIDLGFLCDLVAGANPVAPGIFAPAELGPGAQAEIARLRGAGERVVCGFPGQPARLAELGCDRVLTAGPSGYRIEPAPATR